MAGVFSAVVDVGAPYLAAGGARLLHRLRQGGHQVQHLAGCSWVSGGFGQRPVLPLRLDHLRQCLRAGVVELSVVQVLARNRVHQRRRTLELALVRPRDRAARPALANAVAAPAGKVRGMYMGGRRLRFTAVSAMVVLALTGFSSGRDRGHGSISDGSGCSSSSQDHDSSTSGGGGSHGNWPSGDSHDPGTNARNRGGSSQPASTASPSSHAARPLKDGIALLVQCASMEDPYATVEIRNPNGRDGLFTVKVAFKDKHGYTVIDTSDQVSVPAKDKTTFRVAVASSGRVDMIDHCHIDPTATADR
jgi:hypothetical protein